MFELMYVSFYLEYGPDKYKRILCNSLCRGAEVLDLHPGRLSRVRRTGFESVGSKERIWSPPVICHILCCWWQKRSESHKSETHLVSHEKNELCWIFLAPTPLIMWVEKSNSGKKKKRMTTSQYRVFQKNTRYLWGQGGKTKVRREYTEALLAFADPSVWFCPCAVKIEMFMDCWMFDSFILPQSIYWIIFTLKILHRYPTVSKV